ncbi:RING finger 11 [Paramuricea clavata]|uniref:RING finger 11 n=1 Tax=Paramuricea clavata TaxID=317549 RepID=A0A7D9HLP1_PARCT|nr:RING finger 11 [Paramuricea clavata]
MGNCLKTPTSDDISLLHEEHGALNSRGEPPPPYQEEPPYSCYIQSQRAPHLLSEEQQIRLAQRLGLIQHLPVGKYDETKKKRDIGYPSTKTKFLLFLMGEFEVRADDEKWLDLIEEVDNDQRNANVNKVYAPKVHRKIIFLASKRILVSD